MSEKRKVALITGGSRGIGRGICLALAREGLSCIVNYAANEGAAREVKEEIERVGGAAVIVQADVSVAADRARLVEEAYAAYGLVDLLVNNAGVAPLVRADILEATEESFERVMGTNLQGPYFLTQLVARRMIEQVQRGEGEPPQIVNIGSISAYTASVHRGEYCIAKAGVSMMTKLYAARLAEYGIRVYEIRPGAIETDMTGPVKAKYDKLIAEGLSPIQRWGTAEDVGRAVVAIAKGLLPFSTGEVINVDGGFHLRRI